MGLISRLFSKPVPPDPLTLRSGGYSLSTYFGIEALRVPTWAKHWSVDHKGSLVVWETTPTYDDYLMEFEAEGKCLHLLMLDKDNILTTAKGALYNVY